MSTELMTTLSKTLNVNATLTRAKSHTKKGQLDEAKRLYHSVLEAFPQNQQAKKGLKALQNGEVNKKNQSEPPLAQVDSLIVLYSQGQIQKALTTSEALIQDYPNAPLLYNISGACYQALGQLDAAVKSYEQALAIKPDYAKAHNNLGNTLNELGQLDSAVKSYEQALTIKPDYAEAHSNLGLTLHELGQLEAAIKRYEKALAIKPDFVEVHSNLGNTLKKHGQLEAAVKCYEKALAIKPDYAEAHNNLGNTLKALDQLDAAVKSYEQALTIKPDYAEAHSNLGTTLKELGQLKAAVKSYEQALAIKPDYAEAHSNLGTALNELGQLEAAVKSYEKALAIKPNYADAHSSLGATLKELGQLDAAVKSHENALAINPDYAVAYSNLLFTLNYHPDLSAEAIFKHYQEYDQRFGLPYRDQWQDHANTKNLTRRLKIGYVSPDFREHSIKGVLTSIITHHNHDLFEITAYAEIMKEDDYTEFYKANVDCWVQTNGRSNDVLADQIRTSEIDILIDLAGHTKNNRLGVFAHKPAPISISMMGYGYTTGLSAIDYFIGDEPLFPAGSEYLFSEQPFALSGPGFCYRPSEGMGEVNSLPALEKGYVTFGTLTRSVRINHKTIQVWSEVLKQVKGSKLILNSKSFVDPNFQKTMAGRFSAEGISCDRLVMGYDSPPWDVLRQIDISFDCFPHNSGQTLIESLYMGVPYITLAGRPSVGRIGASILIAANCSKWIAKTENQYIDKAVVLASNLTELANIRSRLRKDLENLPVMDAVGYVRRLENVYHQMWEKWCKNE